MPPQIGLIPNLISLDLAYNRLEGPLLSTFVGDPGQGVSLLLAGNGFTGDAPPEWTQDGNFLNLTVSWNCLTVTDPAAQALLDLRDPGWESTQCVRIFADGFESGHSLQWDGEVDGSGP